MHMAGRRDLRHLLFNGKKAGGIKFPRVGVTTMSANRLSVTFDEHIRRVANFSDVYVSGLCVFLNGLSRNSVFLI